MSVSWRRMAPLPASEAGCDCSFKDQAGKGESMCLRGPFMGHYNQSGRLAVTAADEPGPCGGTDMEGIELEYEPGSLLGPPRPGHLRAFEAWLSRFWERP